MISYLRVFRGDLDRVGQVDRGQGVSAAHSNLMHADPNKNDPEVGGVRVGGSGRGEYLVISYGSHLHDGVKRVEKVMSLHLNR